MTLPSLPACPNPACEQPHIIRQTHAFAKRDATWHALVGLQLFDHTFYQAHQVLQLSCEEGVHRYRQQSPDLALGLTGHLWSFQELLTSRVPLTPSWDHSWLFRLVDFLLLILLDFSSRESLALPTSSSLGLELRIGLLDTGAIRRQRAWLRHRSGRHGQRPRFLSSASPWD